MHKNKIVSLLLTLSVAQFSAITTAEPAAQVFPCFRNSSQMLPGVAQPGEYKVVHSYNVNCPTTLHMLTLRTQRGARLPMNIEKLQGGNWIMVARAAWDPTVNYGGGVFRVVLDNQAGKAPVAYRGTFSLPL